MINFFPHDINASQDPKIIRLLMKHGSKGYGLYWRIIELMAQNSKGELTIDYNLLGYTLRESAELIKSVIHDFDLFVISSESFYSKRLAKEIQFANDKSLLAKQKAEKRWSKSKSNTIEMPQHNNGNTIEMPQHSSSNAHNITEHNITEHINNISIKNDGGDSVKLLLPPPVVTENATAKAESKAAKQEQIALEGDFEFFWTIYPKKKGKKEALRAYLKARKKTSRDELLEALREIKAKEWKFKELQYVPNAATWLNQERWADEVQQEQKKADPLDDLDLETNPFDF